MDLEDRLKSRFALGIDGSGSVPPDLETRVAILMTERVTRCSASNCRTRGGVLSAKSPFKCSEL